MEVGNMNKEEAVEVYFNDRYYEAIEDAVKFLEEYKSKGESVYIDFKGHRLYSCDVTLDSAYMQVTGMTNAEYEAVKEESNKEDEETLNKDIITLRDKWRNEYKNL